MKTIYQFTTEGIKRFYDDVCDYTIKKLQSKDLTEKEININISIGEYNISVPNTADNVEELYGFLVKTRENTIDFADFMNNRILETVKNYYLTNKDVLSETEIKNLEEQIIWLTNIIAANGNEY